MYTMLRDSNPIAAKISLDVMVELYKRNIWWENRAFALTCRDKYLLEMSAGSRAVKKKNFFSFFFRNDAKTVNVITTACFSKVTKVGRTCIFIVSFFHLSERFHSDLPGRWMSPRCDLTCSGLWSDPGRCVDVLPGERRWGEKGQWFRIRGEPHSQNAPFKALMGAPIFKERW